MLIGVWQRVQTAASLVVHFAGTRLTEALMTAPSARHQRDACITRCHETHLAEVNGCVSWYGRWRTDVVKVSSSFWCCVLSSGASVSSSLSASEWLSLSMFSESLSYNGSLLTMAGSGIRGTEWRHFCCFALPASVTYRQLGDVNAGRVVGPGPVLRVAPPRSIVRTVTVRRHCHAHIDNDHWTNHVTWPRCSGHVTVVLPPAIQSR